MTSSKVPSLSQQFPYASDDLIDILSKMLEFNPFFRPTARELLQHPVFNKLYDPRHDIQAPYKIYIDIDENEYTQIYSQKEGYSVPKSPINE